MTARTLVSGSSNAVVKVLKLDDREICLNKGDVIGKCEEVVWMKKCSSMTGADLAKSNNYELVTELLDDCKSNLTYSQSMKAKKFLQRYANIFSSHEGDLGRTSVVQHRIDTGSERPIRQRARRIPIAKEKEVEGLVGEACLVYLDDVIIVGRDFEDHLQNLERVFAKIEGSKLKLKPEKVSFIQK
ncbi:uncharacterized protein LOC123665826 [Melitaea cinxia]|uniref:uncharacterized protein LOC123665826 n=1 Tax=Melitaea cinxia TaxID=113334 RepID=UPI001E2710C3|nr:uncharacterized protein LOC123665826 [Melitaea cinxia]